jgi:hypothetical protein
MSKNKKIANDWQEALSGIRGKIRRTGDNSVMDVNLRTGSAEIHSGSHREEVCLTKEQIHEFSNNQMEIQKAIAKEKRSAFIANCAVAAGAIIGTIVTAYATYKTVNHANKSHSV